MRTNDPGDESHHTEEPPGHADQPLANGHVRSFHRRQGRMGPELQSAWQNAGAIGMPAGRWELPPRTVLEIGSGMGDSLIAAARLWDLVIGVEVHVKGLAATARAASALGLTNLAVVEGDAMEVLRDSVMPAALQEIHVWFPDPWPKARHHKRRLLRPAVASLLASRLQIGGVLRLATDVPEYAGVMVAVLAETDGLAPMGHGGVVERPAWRPVTRYEQAGLSAGRLPTEIAFRRRQH